MAQCRMHGVGWLQGAGAPPGGRLAAQLGARRLLGSTAPRTWWTRCCSAPSAPTSRCVSSCLRRFPSHASPLGALYCHASSTVLQHYTGAAYSCGDAMHEGLLHVCRSALHALAIMRSSGDGHILEKAPRQLRSHGFINGLSARSALRKFCPICSGVWSAHARSLAVQHRLLQAALHRFSTGSSDCLDT